MYVKWRSMSGVAKVPLVKCAADEFEREDARWKNCY